MSISDPNLPPEAEFPLTPDVPVAALDWLARQTGGSIPGCCDDAQSDRCMPEGSALLPDFLTRLGPDDPWPTLRNLSLRGSIEFRFLDALLPDAWTPWFNPTDPGAPLDVAALIARARSAVTPTRPSEPAEDPVHAAGLGRQMDEYVVRRAAEGITIEPFVMDPDDTLQPGEVNPFFAPIVRLTSRGLDDCRTRAAQPPSEPVTGLVINEKRCEVRWNGTRLAINRHSHFKLLRCLKQAEGMVTHADLYRVIHPDKISDLAVNGVACQEVKDAFWKIRRALEAIGCPWTIDSDKGKGYILIPPLQSE